MANTRKRASAKASEENTNKPSAADTKASKAAAQEKALKVLAPLARHANAALEKAQIADGRADDLRLTAAIDLGKAKTQCVGVGINFKAWCGENVAQSYETVRKLATIGQADDPAQALADLRDRTKKSAKNTRAKKANQPASVSGDIRKMIAAMPEDEMITIIKKQAKTVGMAVVSGEIDGSYEGVQKAFSALKKSEKMKFVAWAGEEVGATVKL